MLPGCKVEMCGDSTCTLIWFKCKGGSTRPTTESDEVNYVILEQQHSMDITDIEKDATLERRSQLIFVGQPSVEDNISILRGLNEHYELNHDVTISDGALVATVVLPEQYISRGFISDKEINLVDEAIAELKMEMTSKPTKLDEVDRVVLKLEMECLSLKNDTDKASKEHRNKLVHEKTHNLMHFTFI